MDSCSMLRLITSANRFAVDNIFKLSISLCCGIGIVSVTTISLILAFFSRSTAGPENMACVVAK